MVSIGLQLSLMGIDMNEFDCAMKLYIRELLLDIKPLVSNVSHVLFTLLLVYMYVIDPHTNIRLRMHSHIHMQC